MQFDQFWSNVTDSFCFTVLSLKILLPLFCHMQDLVNKKQPLNNCQKKTKVKYIANEISVITKVTVSVTYGIFRHRR